MLGPPLNPHSGKITALSMMQPREQRQRRDQSGKILNDRSGMRSDAYIQCCGKKTKTKTLLLKEADIRCWIKICSYFKNIY